MVKLVFPTANSGTHLLYDAKNAEVNGGSSFGVPSTHVAHTLRALSALDVVPPTVQLVDAEGLLGCIEVLNEASHNVGSDGGVHDSQVENAESERCSNGHTVISNVEGECIIATEKRINRWVKPFELLEKEMSGIIVSLTTLDTVAEVNTSLTTRKHGYTDFVTALLFATGATVALEVTVGIASNRCGPAGYAALDFLPWLFPEVETKAHLMVEMSITPLQGEGTSFAIFVTDQGSPSDAHPVNSIVREMTGEGMGEWRGNMLVVHTDLHRRTFENLEYCELRREFG
ncbi:hypothetical protein C8R44DRAFT_746954 [Mycena epipterygia]|nr:hypothetical protein C8R44DRAFT_746954 [Mycena epipterygia]